MNPIEPSSVMRQWAHTLREMYVALVAEGFTDKEALAMVGTAIGAGLQGGRA